MKNKKKTITDEGRKLMKIVKNFDLNKDGKTTMKELFDWILDRNAIEKLGIEACTSLIRLVYAIDTDNNG